jgi:hypothetical protein
VTAGTVQPMFADSPLAVARRIRRCPGGSPSAAEVAVILHPTSDVGECVGTALPTPPRNLGLGVDRLTLLAGQEQKASHGRPSVANGQNAAGERVPRDLRRCDTTTKWYVSDRTRVMPAPVPVRLRAPLSTRPMCSPRLRPSFGSGPDSRRSRRL